MTIKAIPRECASSTKTSDDESQEGKDLVDLALFQHESKWLTAARRVGHDIPLTETNSDPALKVTGTGSRRGRASCCWRHSENISAPSRSRTASTSLVRRTRVRQFPRISFERT